jgi:hypothetical protein
MSYIPISSGGGPSGYASNILPDDDLPAEVTIPAGSTWHVPGDLDLSATDLIVQGTVSLPAPAYVPLTASTETAGLVRLATLAETRRTSNEIAVTPGGLQAELAELEAEINASFADLPWAETPQIGAKTKLAGGVGAYGLAWGYISSANGSYATAGGYACNASAQAAVAMGYWAQASAKNSAALGSFSHSHLTGAVSGSSGRIYNQGDSQWMLLSAGVQTTDATPKQMPLDPADTQTRLTVYYASAYTFTIWVTAATLKCAQVASYKFEGVIKRDANSNPNTTTLLALTKTVIHEDDSAWDCNVTADDANDALVITVTGKASTAIRWSAAILLSQIYYPY